jgi:methenyltetrahydrofolate cyclohydrolase
MAARFAPGDQEAVIERAALLRTRALELADVELHAYEPVLEALRLPQEDPARADRVAAAQLEASRSPLEIAEIAAELADRAEEIARTGNPNLAGDAVAGALLAHAAAQAAARLVAINLTGGPAVEQADEHARRAAAARDRALG